VLSSDTPIYQIFAIEKCGDKKKEKYKVADYIDSLPNFIPEWFSHGLTSLSLTSRIDSLFPQLGHTGFAAILGSS